MIRITAWSNARSAQITDGTKHRLTMLTLQLVKCLCGRRLEFFFLIIIISHKSKQTPRIYRFLSKVCNVIVIKAIISVQLSVALLLVTGATSPKHLILQYSLIISESSVSKSRDQRSAHLDIGKLIYLKLRRFDYSSTVTTQVTHTCAEYFAMIWAW